MIGIFFRFLGYLALQRVSNGFVFRNRDLYDVTQILNLHPYGSYTHMTQPRTLHTGACGKNRIRNPNPIRDRKTKYQTPPYVIRFNV